MSKKQLICEMVGKGMSVKEISCELGMKANTVYAHLSRMGISVRTNRTNEALEYALKHGMHEASVRYGLCLGTLYNARSKLNKGVQL